MDNDAVKMGASDFANGSGIVVKPADVDGLYLMLLHFLFMSTARESGEGPGLALGAD